MLEVALVIDAPGPVTSQLTPSFATSHRVGPKGRAFDEKGDRVVFEGESVNDEATDSRATTRPCSDEGNRVLLSRGAFQ